MLMDYGCTVIWSDICCIYLKVLKQMIEFTDKTLSLFTMRLNLDLIYWLSWSKGCREGVKWEKVWFKWWLVLWFDIFFKTAPECHHISFISVFAVITRNSWAFSKQLALSLAFTCCFAASSDCVNDNITNMSQVAFREMEYHLFHRGLAR